jgi:hypothetical protein
VDELTPALLARLPLAEAALLTWRLVADETHLQDLFQRFRGRCYEKVLSFPTLVGLVTDALLAHGGNACRTFHQAREAGTLTASLAAAYGKLRRWPVALSMAFLAESTERLRALLPLPPAPPTDVPRDSLSALTVVLLDGKAIKRVAKRLQPLRGVRGGLLGGRALVALTPHDGLALAMHAHPDGEANDVRFVPALLPEVRRRVPGPRLFVADRQFCSPVVAEQFTEDGDHFVVRYHRNVTFAVDASMPSRTGQDRRGRTYREEWGWLGRPGHRQRHYVRRLTLERPDEEPVVLITDLLDADRYRAADLLEVYLQRWGIERVFQQVTEVFHLDGLIGSSPQATVFQFAFCLLLYNLIQVLRTHVAQAQRRPVETVSAEKLFDAVTRQLTAWSVLADVPTTVQWFGDCPAPAVARARLAALVAGVWHDYWIKAPPRPRRPPKIGGRRSHGSVYRVLEAHRRPPHRMKVKSEDV